MWDDNSDRENLGPFVPPPPQRKKYPWWSDPDTDPPDWMLQPGNPPVQATPGKYWNWAGDHWEMLDAPGAGLSAAETQGAVKGPDSVDRVPGAGDRRDYGGPGGVSTTYGGGGTGKFDYGRPEGMLPFTPYTPLQWEKFSFGDFAPTDRRMLYDENLNPGFKWSQDRLGKQIEGGAAYQGMLRSGMTFDRLGSILGQNEGQEFKAFDDRRARDYGMNRANKFGAWEANLGVAERENTNQNNFRFNTEKASFDDMLSRWQELVRSTTQLARPVG